MSSALKDGNVATLIPHLTKNTIKKENKGGRAHA